MLYLFHDVHRKEHRRGSIARSAVFVHLDQQHHLLDTLGKASAFTKMSVPPLCAVKQLWLRDGRTVVPQPIELFRLLELADSIHDSFIAANPNAPPSATYGNAGDGIAVRLAEPMAARLTTRLRALAARDAYDSAANDGSFERRAAAHFDVIDDGATYVALITADATGSLRLLVASDLVSLPRLPVGAVLRAALQARPRSDPYRAYLLEWVDQIDTTPNALTPHALRGVRPDYANPKLVTTPVPDAAPSAKTDPIQFPRAQRTAYKPRKLTDILYPWAIKKLDKALRGVVADPRAWLQRPTRPRR